MFQPSIEGNEMQHTYSQARAMIESTAVLYVDSEIETMETNEYNVREEFIIQIAINEDI